MRYVELVLHPSSNYNRSVSKYVIPINDDLFVDGYKTEHVDMSNLFNREHTDLEKFMITFIKDAHGFPTPEEPEGRCDCWWCTCDPQLDFCDICKHNCPAFSHGATQDSSMFYNGYYTDSLGYSFLLNGGIKREDSQGICCVGCIHVSW